MLGPRSKNDGLGMMVEPCGATAPSARQPKVRHLEHFYSGLPMRLPSGGACPPETPRSGTNRSLWSELLALRGAKAPKVASFSQEEPLGPHQALYAIRAKKS